MAKILAGKTNIPCGTTVRITDVCEEDQGDVEAERIIGLWGTITHPFIGLSVPSTIYIAGVWLDPSISGIFIGGKVNLVQGDTFEVIDESTAEEYPDDVVEGEI